MALPQRTKDKSSPSDAPEPWERQPGERDKPFAAFCHYRDAGPERSLKKAVIAFYGEGHINNRGQVDKWSSHYHWVMRAGAYDDYLDERRRAESEASLLKTQARWVAELELQQHTALLPHREILQRLEDGRMNLDKFENDELMRLSRLMTYGYTMAVRSHRVALGLPERGPIVIDDDRDEDHLESAVRRLADALNIPEAQVVDEVARRRKGTRGG